MEKFKKEMGVNPEFIKSIVAKVKANKAKYKDEYIDSDNLVKTIVEKIAGHPVNIDDHKDMVAMVKKQIAKVKSGEIDISKYMKQ